MQAVSASDISIFDFISSTSSSFTADSKIFPIYEAMFSLFCIALINFFTWTETGFSSESILL